MKLESVVFLPVMIKYRNKAISLLVINFRLNDNGHMAQNPLF